MVSLIRTSVIASPSASAMTRSGPALIQPPFVATKLADCTVGALLGRSSSVMVRLPVASEIVALDALESVRVAVSLASSLPSSRMGTLKLLVVSPAAKVKVPEAAV